MAFGSNAVRLTAAQWLATVLILAVLYLGAPRVWERLESFEPGPGYRIPYALSNDYWLYQRYARAVVGADHVLIIGDSVIWGQYVPPGETLSGHLNRLTGDERFVNLGLNGTHPVALAGLVRYYGQDIADSKVVLHYNPLWMSAKRRDLQATKATRFNHPKLIPQFFPRIPSYNASYSERLGVAIARESAFFSWTAHLRHAYFQNRDIPAWTLDHPYENPVSVVTLRLPEAQAHASSEPIPWFEKGVMKQRFSWLGLDDSLQWALFVDSLRTLENRHNDVFVIVGPFNEHMLTTDNQAVYAQLRDAIQAWLAQNAVNHSILPVLPSELYADASHPLSQGYAELARQLLQHEWFREFLPE